MRGRRAVLFVAVGVLGFLAAPTAGADDLNVGQELVLTQLAEKYLQERAGLLLMGSNASEAFDSMQVGPDMHVQLRSDSANIDELRRRFEYVGLRYTGADVSVAVKDAELSTGVAVLQLREPPISIADPLVKGTVWTMS